MLNILFGGLSEVIWEIPWNPFRGWGGKTGNVPSGKLT